MNMFKKFASLLTVLMVLCSFSLAYAADGNSSIEVEGSVVNVRELPVAATSAGTISDIQFSEGAHVSKGETIATLTTSKIYAREDGTVQIFGDVGDSTEMLTERYGAVAYVEPAIRYTVSASTRNAYDDEENRIIHPGETVYLRGTSTLTDTGIGTVTQVNGSSFTVEIVSGSFIASEGVTVFRDSEYTNTSRIGKGNTSRKDYSVYQGDGVVVRYHVASGDQVKKGDLLYETLAGDYAGNGYDPTVIVSPEDGIITSLSIQAGSSVSAGDKICSVYPDDSMRVQADIDEEGLNQLHLGDDVTIRFSYISGGEYIQSGVIESISGVGIADESGESEESFYSAIIRMNEISDIRYGMSVTVSD